METSCLRLNLKSRWYDMIESCEKLEEYREIKPYWLARLLTVDGMKTDKSYWLFGERYHLDRAISDGLYIGEFLKFDTVEFVYGYTSRTMKFKCNGIRFGEGKPEWGAEPGVYYIVISIGERVDLQPECGKHI